jgi:hypothetical protein
LQQYFFFWLTFSLSPITAEPWFCQIGAFAVLVRNFGSVLVVLRFLEQKESDTIICPSLIQDEFDKMSDAVRYALS